MKTIERYVSGSCLSAFLLAWLVLTFVLSVGLLVKVTSLIAKGMSVAIVGRYLLTAIPETLGFTIPLAILVAALLVFGRLSADSEIAAMRACGVDLLQIMRAPLGFALAMSLLCLYLNNEVTPRNDRRLDLLRAQASADLGLDAMEPGKFNDGPGGMAICFARRQGDWLYDVLIFGRGHVAANALRPRLDHRGQPVGVRHLDRAGGEHRRDQPPEGGPPQQPPQRQPLGAVMRAAGQRCQQRQQAVGDAQQPEGRHNAAPVHAGGLQQHHQAGGEDQAHGVAGVEDVADRGAALGVDGAHHGRQQRIRQRPAAAGGECGRAQGTITARATYPHPAAGLHRGREHQQAAEAAAVGHAGGGERNHESPEPRAEQQALLRVVQA